MHRHLLSCLLAVTISGCAADTDEAIGAFPDGKGDAPQSCKLPSSTVAAAAKTTDKAAAMLSSLLALQFCDSAIAQTAEQRMLDLIALLDANGKLGPAIELLANVALERGAIPAELAPKLPEMIDQLTGMVDAELCARGRVPECADNVYKPWNELAAEHLAQIHASALTPAGPGSPSHLEDPRFVTELEELSGQSFVDGNTVQLLVDGPASFALRDQLIQNATRSIDLMTWAIYDDTTGWATANQLLAKAQAGVKVHVIVDGQVAERAGYNAVVTNLEQHGIPVIRWRDPVRHYDGNHRKLLVVDGAHAIAGGMNIGDWYSHRGSAGTPKWRDTDIAFDGRAVSDASAVFAAAWNEQVSARHLALPILVPTVAPGTSGTGGIAVTNHVAGKDSSIQLATLKAIEGATTSIDLEPAYFITTPDLRAALLAALARHVHVRILTNSAESIDEPIMSVPIMNSLPELLDAGAEVYTKRGDTLHSKFMIVDGVYSWVGSYNLHPRSQRYESELAIQVLDHTFAARLGTTFAADIAAAQRVSRGSLSIPSSAFTFLASRYFFDQL